MTLTLPLSPAPVKCTFLRLSEDNSLATTPKYPAARFPPAPRPLRAGAELSSGSREPEGSWAQALRMKDSRQREPLCSPECSDMRPRTL